MDKIKADLIFEILGRPKEHIVEALSLMMDKLGAEVGVKVATKKIHEPTEVRESKDLYTTFAEVSVEFDKLENLFGIMFAYMPANIEIVSPVNFELSNIQVNDLTNKLLARLHNYDAITKKFIYERDYLLNKLKEVAPELFKQIGSEKQEVKTEPAEEQKGKPGKKAKKSKN